MQDRHVSVGRLVASWVAGLTLSALLLLGPPAAGGTMLGRAARVVSGWSEQRQRWEVGRVADERWAARQRAAGPVAVAFDGTPIYAVVRVPSGPSSTELPARIARDARMLHRTMLAWGLLIPVLLVLRTRRWLRERRRLAELRRVAPTALAGPSPGERAMAATRRHAHVDGRA
jgi:hypothetical protein